MSTEHRDSPPPGMPLDIDEIADLLRITPRTARKLVAAGMPHLRVGKKLRFISADVLAWCSVPASSDSVRAYEAIRADNRASFAKRSGKA